MTAHKWLFAPRFRRHAFGWRSETPIQRIKEALKEIKQTARKEPVLAAEGAILLIQKLSPALELVDSSSGAIGSMVNKALEDLVGIIAKANVDTAQRQIWLEKLWKALQDDEMPYIESLGDYWGELCVTPELASRWADALMPLEEESRKSKAFEFNYFKGTSVCLSSLYGAGRYEALLDLMNKANYKSWSDRRWAVKALFAMGKKADAIKYAEKSRRFHNPGGQIALACEEILLSSGMVDEAYRRYALEANQSTTNLSRFRAIAKKYPSKQPSEILQDLVSSAPGSEGKWFATAKELEFWDWAIELAMQSPTDPKTLTRAARDFGDKHPNFAFAAGLASLFWISQGHGYEITGVDVIDAHKAILQAALNAGLNTEAVNDQIMEIASGTQPGCSFIKSILSL